MQGLTVDNAFVLAVGEGSLKEWGYVALSRARHTTRLYTTTAELEAEIPPAYRPERPDSIEQLAEALTRPAAETTALERKTQALARQCRIAANRTQPDGTGAPRSDRETRTQRRRLPGAPRQRASHRDRPKQAGTRETRRRARISEPATAIAETRDVEDQAEAQRADARTASRSATLAEASESALETTEEPALEADLDLHHAPQLARAREIVLPTERRGHPRQVGDRRHPRTEPLADVLTRTRLGEDRRTRCAYPPARERASAHRAMSGTRAPVPRRSSSRRRQPASRRSRPRSSSASASRIPLGFTLRSEGQMSTPSVTSSVPRITRARPPITT